MAKITPMIESTGISAHPRPRSRRSRPAQPASSARGEATTPACSASRPASDGISGSVGSTQTLLEPVELLVQLDGQPRTELRVVGVDLRDLVPPSGGIHAQQLPQLGLGDIEAVDVDAALAYRRQEPDLSLDRLRRPLAAAEDPCEHTRVLPVSGPQELAVSSLAEPV